GAAINAIARSCKVLCEKQAGTRHRPGRRTGEILPAPRFLSPFPRFPAVTDPPRPEQKPRSPSQGSTCSQVPRALNSFGTAHRRAFSGPLIRVILTTDPIPTCLRGGLCSI